MLIFYVYLYFILFFAFYCELICIWQNYNFITIRKGPNLFRCKPKVQSLFIDGFLQTVDTLLPIGLNHNSNGIRDRSETPRQRWRRCRDSNKMVERIERLEAAKKYVDKRQMNLRGS